MILRSLRVEGWKCFPEAIGVGPFSEGLNVVYAPNSTGKSSLFEALLRGILDGHRVTGKEVESFRPWDRTLAPTIIAEISHGGIDYRFTKRFLSKPISKLERKERDRFVPLSEGTEADERIRALLTHKPSGRGLARQDNWGLAQVLWAPQSDLKLTKLSGDLVTSIRESLGVQLIGAGPLEEQVKVSYDEFYTQKGQFKKSSRLLQLREELERALQERRIALTNYQDFEEASRRVEDLRARHAQAKRDAEAITTALSDAHKQADIYRELLSQKGQREEQVKAAEATYSKLKRHIDAIVSVRKDLKLAEESMGELNKDLPLLIKELREREAAASSSKVTLENIRKDRKKVDKIRAMAQAAGILARTVERERQVKLLLSQVRKAANEYEKLKSERVGLVAPDAKAMRAIMNTLKTRDEAQVRLDSAFISLEIVPEKALSVEIISGEETGKRKLAPRHPTEIKGTPEVVVDIPGVGRLRARGPSESADELQAERDKANRKLEELTRSYGTSDMNAIEVLKERADNLDKKIAQAETRLNSLLGERTIEEIEQEVAQAKAEIETVLKQYPNWRKKPPDMKEVEKEAEDTRKAFIAAIEPAERSWEIAGKALSAIREKKVGAEARIAEGEKQLVILKQRLQELTSDGVDDAQRDKELRMATLAWDAAQITLKEANEKLSAYSSDPRETVTKLERQRKAAEDSATRTLEAEKTEEGRLQHLVAQGFYSVLSQVEENIARLESEIVKEKLRADAIKLLYSTLASCRSEALAGITEPVEVIVTRNLQRIAGTRFGQVRLDETFEPVNIIPQGTGVTAIPEDLSGGEKEQIYFVTRLALADVLAREERHLVVLDDTLVFTDPSRLARALSLLEEAAQNNQVIILTCRPEWYRGIETASFIDLEAIVQASKT